MLVTTGRSSAGSTCFPDALAGDLDGAFLPAAPLAGSLFALFDEPLAFFDVPVSFEPPESRLGCPNRPVDSPDFEASSRAA